MKRFLILLLLSFSTPLFAQNIQGLVIDFNSHSPVSNVQIISNNNFTILSDQEGRFTLVNVKKGDKISLKLMGYETQEIIIAESMFKMVITIALKSAVVDLSTVSIKGKRNYQLDSLRMRKEFGKEFNYKTPSINDMFVTIDPNYIPPLALRKPNSTTALASLNLLKIVSLASKSKAQRSKLKEMLLQDEEANYVDHIFSKSKVESITALKGDSLQEFMKAYRPSAVEAKHMNDYKLILYIKKSYGDFKKQKPK